MIDLCDGCRHYLDFSHDLKSLLEEWKIGQTGSEAYRSGFCSRSLTYSFAYLWLSRMLMSLILFPTISAIFTQLLSYGPLAAFVAQLNGFVTKLRKCLFGEDDDEFVKLTIDCSHQSQKLAVQLMVTVVIMTVFGSLVPALFVLGPIMVYLHTCLLYFHSGLCEQTTHITISNVIVQLPKITFGVSSHLCHIAVTIFVMLDLEFSLGPICLYAAFCSVEISTLHYLIVHGASGSGEAHNLPSFLKISTDASGCLIMPPELASGDQTNQLKDNMMNSSLQMELDSAFGAQLDVEIDEHHVELSVFNPEAATDEMKKDEANSLQSSKVIPKGSNDDYDETGTQHHCPHY